MPSTGPSSDIALDSLPFLAPRNTQNDVTGQPAIGRRTPDDDDDEEEDEEAAHDGRDEESSHRHLRHHRRHGRAPTRTTTTIITPAWRRRLYNLLERPNSSAAAVMVHVLVTALIVFSALITILETVPTFHSFPGGIWFGLETSLVALFTVEYVARCVATSYSWSAFFAWVGCALSYFFVSRVFFSFTHPLWRP